MQGPNDSKAKADRVLSVLRAKCGEDGFHFMMPVLPEDEDGDESEETPILAVDSHAGDERLLLLCDPL